MSGMYVISYQLYIVLDPLEWLTSIHIHAVLYKHRADAAYFIVQSIWAQKSPNLDKIATETLFVGNDSHTHLEQHIKNIDDSMQAKIA